MHYGPFKKPWYVQRSIDNNSLQNGLPSTGSIDTIVENIAHGNHGISLFQRAALGGISLLTAFLIACSGGSAPIVTPTPSAVSTQQVVKDGVVIKYNKTDSRGIATFVDSTTDQTVTVEVVDSSSKPLYGMRVQYLDSKDFEGFIVEDPNNQYAPLFRVYPHNAVPPITTNIPTTPLYIPLTMRISGPEVREVKGSSAEKQALDNLVEHAKNEWVYLGRRTPEQLDAENKIYSFIVGLAGINTSVVSDIAGKIGDISDSISGWHEPKFYDVYEVIPANPITTAIRVLVPVESKPEPTLEATVKAIATPIATSTPTGPPQIQDGSKVVFESGGKIYLANISTKEVFQLTTYPQYGSPGNPDLSPNGKLVAYFEGKGRGDEHLWLMDIGTRRAAKLIELVDSPSWSNDGRKIVFQYGMEVRTVDLFQGDCMLKIADTLLFPSSQSFSPDGSRILYNRGFTRNQSTGPISTWPIDRNLGPWIVNSDGSYNRQFISLETTNPNTYQVLFGIDWSIDGRIAAVMHEIDESQNKRYGGIVLMDRDGFNLRRLIWSHLGTIGKFSGGHSSLRWSQDGKYLFYRQIPDEDTDNLFVLDAESGNTLDIKTFTWHKTDKQPTEVSLGELLGKEKKPYSEECFGPSTEGISTLEVDVKYVANVKVEDKQYNFDRDRDIRVRVLYDNKVAAEYLTEYIKEKEGSFPVVSSTVVEKWVKDLIKDNLTKQVIDGTVLISSEYIKTNSFHGRIFIDLESKLFESLSKLGVVNVDIRYFREGSLKYAN